MHPTYRSGRGACPNVFTSPTELSPFCRLHHCPAVGCNQSKSSTEQDCGRHAAADIYASIYADTAVVTAAAGADVWGRQQTAALGWPVAVRQHLFKENAVDVLNKLHRKSCIASLKTIEERFVDAGSPKHIFVSHCTKDEGMKVYEKLDAFFSAREHAVFNPDEEFQKRTASAEAMVDAVKSAQVCIAALSPQFFASKWCLKEVTAAQQAGIPVVPCYAGDFCANAQVDAWVAGNFS